MLRQMANMSLLLLLLLLLPQANRPLQQSRDPVDILQPLAPTPSLQQLTS